MAADINIELKDPVFLVHTGIAFLKYIGLKITILLVKQIKLAYISILKTHISVKFIFWVQEINLIVIQNSV